MWAQCGHIGAAYSMTRTGALGSPRVRSSAVTAMASPEAVVAELSPWPIRNHHAPPSARMAATITPIRIWLRLTQGSQRFDGWFWQRRKAGSIRTRALAGQREQGLAEAFGALEPARGIGGGWLAGPCAARWWRRR